MSPPSPLTEDQLDDLFADIVAAVDAADRNRAISLAAEALQQGLDEPLVMLLAAEGLDADGRALEALGLLRRATEAAPDAAEAWRRYGDALARQGKLAAALQALETALAIAPDIYPALVSAGAVSFRVGDLSAAHGYYERAADLSPDAAEPPAGLAAIAARRNDPAAARIFAEHALALRPDSLTAEMALGRAELLEGAASSAQARMTRLLGGFDMDADSRVGLLDLRAEALDAMDRPADAFADYEARNRLLEQIAAPRLRNAQNERPPERPVEQARRLADYFSASPAEAWRAGAGKDTIGGQTALGHVFLMGFPRSGTTLLEKAMAGHPAIVTLEEVDHLGGVAADLLADTASLDGLARMTSADADARREIYWRGVRETLGQDASGRVVVDKMPLHVAALPVIAKLFPDARILFALRDPRDVVLSCFRRRFQLNAAMFEFLSLAGAARYYDRIMALAEIYRRLLPLGIHEVRHEAMVADLEGEMRRVLAFAGVDWRPEVLGFADRASSRIVTPSDVQLAKGLNADGIGQWRRYERQIAGVFDVLDPWVNRFGYPPSPAIGPAEAVRSWGFGFKIDQTSSGFAGHRATTRPSKP